MLRAHAIISSRGTAKIDAVPRQGERPFMQFAADSKLASALTNSVLSYFAAAEVTATSVRDIICSTGAPGGMFHSASISAGCS